MTARRERPLRDEEGPDEADADLLDDADDTATIECPHCGAEIYEDAQRCPHCGQYVFSDADLDLPAHRSPSWAYVLLLAALAALLWLLLR